MSIQPVCASVDGHQLAAIQTPTLVVAGERDPIVPPAQARLIAIRVSQSSLVMLPGAGHLPFLERSADYHRQISDWLRTP